MCLPLLVHVATSYTQTHSRADRESVVCGRTDRESVVCGRTDRESVGCSQSDVSYRLSERSNAVCTSFADLVPWTANR